MSTVQQIPTRVQRQGANLEEKIQSHTARDTMEQEGRHRGDIHGPNQAIPVANSEPKSCPNVAPAPINPNNLEPDWIQES